MAVGSSVSTPPHPRSSRSFTAGTPCRGASRRSSALLMAPHPPPGGAAFNPHPKLSSASACKLAPADCQGHGGTGGRVGRERVRVGAAQDPGQQPRLGRLLSLWLLSRSRRPPCDPLPQSPFGTGGGKRAALPACAEVISPGRGSCSAVPLGQQMQGLERGGAARLRASSGARSPAALGRF